MSFKIICAIALSFMLLSCGDYIKAPNFGSSQFPIFVSDSDLPKNSDHDEQESADDAELDSPDQISKVDLDEVAENDQDKLVAVDDYVVDENLVDNDFIVEIDIDSAELEDTLELLDETAVPDEDINIPAINNEMVLVKKGEARSTSGSLYVYITYDLYVNKYEITFAEYDIYASETSSDTPYDEGWGRLNRPVINVSWYDAIKYANWLSLREGFAPAYDDECQTNLNKCIMLDDNKKPTSDPRKVKGYRLPLEIEWEYIARGGGSGLDTIFSGSDYIDDVAWYNNNSGLGSQKQSHPVGTKDKNELGIFDMSGNVSELCYDEWDASNRFIRGGNWNEKDSCKVDAKDKIAPSEQSSQVGFRLVRTK